MEALRGLAILPGARTSGAESAADRDGDQDRGRRRLRPRHVGGVGRGARPGRRARRPGPPGRSAATTGRRSSIRTAGSGAEAIPELRAGAARRAARRRAEPADTPSDCGLDRPAPHCIRGDPTRSLPHARPLAGRLGRRGPAGLPPPGQGEPPGLGRAKRATQVPRDPGRLRDARRARHGREPHRTQPTSGRSPGGRATRGGPIRTGARGRAGRSRLRGPTDPRPARRRRPPAERAPTPGGRPQAAVEQGDPGLDDLRRRRGRAVRARVVGRDVVRRVERHVLDDQPEGIRGSPQARPRVPAPSSPSDRRHGRRSPTRR